MSRGCAPGRRGKGMWVKLRGPLVRQVLPVVDPFLRVPRNTELREMSYAWQLLWISRNDVCVAVALFSFEFRVFQYVNGCSFSPSTIYCVTLADGVARRPKHSFTFLVLLSCGGQHGTGAIR